MALHWSDPPRDILVADEQLDAEGDIIYAVSLRTYCRATLEKLEEIFRVRVIFRPHDQSHDHHDD